MSTATASTTTDPGPVDAPGLDDLAGEAANLDGQLPPGQQAQADAAAAADRQQNEAAFGMLCAVALQLLPERYAERYDLKAQTAIVTTFGALCEARGWNAGEVLGRWGPELAFVAAVALPAVPVLMADVKARRQQPQPGQPPAPTPAPPPAARVYEQNMPGSTP